MKKIGYLCFILALLFSMVTLAQPAPTGTGNPPVVTVKVDQPAVKTPETAPVKTPETAPAVNPPAPVNVDKVGTTVDKGKTEGSVPGASGDVTPGKDQEQPEPTLEELGGSAKKVIDDWRALGWLAGCIALVNFLILLLRVKKIDALFEKANIKWLKPVISAVIGGAGGFFSTMATGAGVVQSILYGVIAGLAAVGVHQAVTAFPERNKA